MSECLGCFKDTESKWKRLPVCGQCRFHAKRLQGEMHEKNGHDRGLRYYLQCIRQINLDELEKEDEAN